MDTIIVRVPWYNSTGPATCTYHEVEVPRPSVYEQRTALREKLAQLKKIAAEGMEGLKDDNS